MEIKSFVGIDNWHFFSNRESIRKSINSPFEESRVDLADIETNYYDYYPDLEMKMCYNEDLLLNFIEIFNTTDLIFFNKLEISSLSYIELISLLQEKDNDIEFENGNFIAHKLGLGGAIPSKESQKVKHIFVFPENYYKEPSDEQIDKIAEYYLNLAKGI